MCDAASLPQSGPCGVCLPGCALGGALLCQNHRERCYPYSAEGVLHTGLGQPVSDNFSTFTTPEYPGVSDDQMFSGVKRTYTEVVLNSVSAQEFGDALMSYLGKRSD